MRASRGLLAAASGLLLALTGCTSSGDGDDAGPTAAESSSAAAPTSPATDVEPIELQNCTDEILGLGVGNARGLADECGYLDVSISY